MNYDAGKIEKLCTLAAGAVGSMESDAAMLTRLGGDAAGAEIKAHAEALWNAIKDVQKDMHAVDRLNRLKNAQRANRRVRIGGGG